MLIVSEDVGLPGNNTSGKNGVPVGPLNKGLEEELSSTVDPNQDKEGAFSVVVPNQDLEEGVSTAVAPNKMPECSVCVHHLEDFIPKEMMVIYWKRYWTALEPKK